MNFGRIQSAILLVAVSATLTGCASLPEQPSISTDDAAWALAGADRLPASTTPPAIEDLPSLLAVSDEMRRFAQDATRRESSISDKTRALAAALHAEDGRHLRYDAEATLSAEQAFLQRRANCLSYTLLFVALAREVGIPATFNEVDIPPIWELGDDQTLLLYRHINARIVLTPSQYQIVDVGGEDYSPRYDQRTLTDQAALAQFYNNRAVELRLQRRHGEALRYQLRSLELLPDAGYLWANLSSLYLRDGQLRAASIAITQALLLEPRSVSSYNTAADIHAQLGNTQLAAYFHKRAQAYLEQNPYYHFQLALTALKERDELRAYRETRQAILLSPTDPRFFFLAAELLQRFGDTEHSGEILQIALQLTPDPSQQARYRSKFGKLSARG
ncbi:MAG: transglutaminase domain-containing protein [Nevskia sp.]|nr:transglutaminase domain-containing protein [Nevskia sp.]